MRHTYSATAYAALDDAGYALRDAFKTQNDDQCDSLFKGALIDLVDNFGHLLPTRKSTETLREAPKPYINLKKRLAARKRRKTIRSIVSLFGLSAGLTVLAMSPIAVIIAVLLLATVAYILWDTSYDAQASG